MSHRRHIVLVLLLLCQGVAALDIISRAQLLRPDPVIKKCLAAHSLQIFEVRDGLYVEGAAVTPAMQCYTKCIFEARKLIVAGHFNEVEYLRSFPSIGETMKKQIFDFCIQWIVTSQTTNACKRAYLFFQCNALNGDMLT